MWCRCGSKNGHHKETSLKEIGLRDQNLLIIVDSIVNIINLGGGGGGYDRSQRKRIHLLIVSKTFIRGSKIMRKTATISNMMC